MTQKMAQMICRICDHVLDGYIDHEGATWIHTSQDSALDADHAPDPIPPPAGYRGRCDFCNDPPDFILPARYFATECLRNGASAGDWAACGTCANLINKNDWNGIAARFTSVRESRDGVQATPVEVAVVKRLHRQLRKNITGPIRPMTDTR